MKSLFTVSLLLFFSLVSISQERVFPVIKGYGAIEVVPFEVQKPDPNQEYKLINELYFGFDNKEKLYGNLDYAARIVNAHVAAGVPLYNLKMAIVIYSGATPIVLNNEEYNKRFGFDNPNIELLDRLVEAGVEVIVCGQSMMKQNIAPGQVHQGLTLAFSRITATSELIIKGYSIF